MEQMEVLQDNHHRIPLPLQTIPRKSTRNHDESDVSRFCGQESLGALSFSFGTILVLARDGYVHMTQRDLHYYWGIPGAWK